MKIYAQSDVGKARDMNQDSYSITDEAPYKLCILADGMGGYKGGEIASKLAVSATENYIKNNFDGIEKNVEQILNLIGNAIEYANMIVYEKSKEDAELKDMGTTLDVSLIYNGKVYIGHVGDSRVYRIRKNIIRSPKNAVITDKISRFFGFCGIKQPISVENIMLPPVINGY